MECTPRNRNGVLRKLLIKLESLDYILGSIVSERVGGLTAVAYYDSRVVATWPSELDGTKDGCLFGSVRDLISEAGWNPVLISDGRTIRYEWVVRD